MSEDEIMPTQDEHLLVPTKQYLKSGIHIGTKFKTKYMENFIYKIRPDGLSVLNLQKIDDRLKTLVKMLSRYKPEEIIIACRRENGWRSVKMFGKLTGAKVFAGRFPPGILTNPALDNFIEAKIMVVCDSWPDRNAINDAMKIGIPVVALCDTNNLGNNIDFVMPCNNKGKKSLGLLFWILTKNYMLNQGLIASESEFTYTVEDFTEQ